MPPPKGLLSTKKKGRGGEEIASHIDIYFLMYIFQGTDARVGDSFAPLGPPLLLWENCMGRGQQTTTHGQTSQLLDQIGQVDRFGEKNTIINGEVKGSEDLLHTGLPVYNLI